MQPVVGGDASKLALVSEQSDLLDMITLRFSEASSYAIGDYVLYFNNVFDGLYRFKEAKAPGVWDGTKVEQVSLTSILKQHESDISSLNADIGRTTFKYFIGTGKPEDVVKANWSTLPGLNMIFCMIEAGTITFAILQTYWDDKYGAALFFGYATDSPYFLRLNNGQWSEKYFL